MQSTKYTIYAYIIIIEYYSIGFAKSASKFSGKLTKGGVGVLLIRRKILILVCKINTL